MTNEEIAARLGNLDAWVAHITVGVDQLHDLVVQMATAGAEADKRIAKLAHAQLATETILQRYLASLTKTNGGKPSQSED